MTVRDTDGATVRSDAAPSPAAGGDEQLGPYRVVEMLGAGGMGEVLCVQDPALGRRMAAKRIRGEIGQRLRDKFVAEARITGQLEHPNIVPVHALARDTAGRLYFTMKEVRGQDLARVLSDPGAEAASSDPAATRRRLVGHVETLLKICDAMAFAHDQGVIHRDLKPANIMVGAFGEVLVMDWGLARVTGRPDGAAETLALDPDGSGGPLRTLDGTVAGTPAYMPPEQARGEISRLDGRADVYALGAILYEMLTLSPPYEGGSAREVLKAVLAGGHLPASRRAPDRFVPWELEAVAERALAREPENRYPDVSALKDDLQAWLIGQPLAAARYSRVQLALKWAARHRTLSAVAGVLLLVAAGLAGWLAWRRAATGRSVAALLAQADSFQAARRWADAQAVCEAALQLAPSHAPAKAIRANCAARIAAARLETARLTALERLRSEVEPLASVIETCRTAQYAAGIDAVARLKDVDRVVARLRSIVASDASFAPAWRLLGVGLALRGRESEAIAALREAVHHAPDDGAARYHLGRTLLGRSIRLTRAFRREEGGAVATQAAVHLERSQNRWVGARPIDRHLAQTFLAYARGDQTGARRLCREGIERYAAQMGVEELWLLLGDADGRRSLEPLEAALAIRPHHAQALITAALQRTDPARARAELARAQALEPANPTPVLAAVHYHAQRLKDEPNVRRLLERAETLGADPQDLLAIRAGAMLFLGRLDEAEAANRRLLELDPRSLPARLNGASVCLQRRDPARAERELDRAIALHPRAWSAYAARAHARIQLDKHAAALADLNVALGKDPRSRPMLYLQRGQLRARQGDVDGAIADFGEAARRRPRWALPLNERGTLHMRPGGDAAQALADFREAARREPTFAPAWANYGIMLGRQGRRDEALDALRKALEVATPEYRAQIESIYRRVGGR